jgi:signal transduction histidine kinase
LDFLSPECQEKGREVFHKYRKIGAISNVELRVRKKDGSEILALYTGRIGHNPDGSFRQTYCIFEDITERKRAEDALRIANKKLKLLSSLTRHDINNQILVVNGFLGLLQNEIQNPSSEHLFTSIANASDRIAAMIRFTREYNQVGVNAPIWQDCRILAGAAAKAVTPGQVTVKNDLLAGTEVFADPLLSRVCSNLIDNALRHGRTVTTIRFVFEEHDDRRVLVCEDDGDGVPADEKERIFDRGYGKNTGLGLTLAREILDITGITIKECGEPGKGARFELTVPEEGWRKVPASTGADLGPV